MCISVTDGGHRVESRNGFDGAGGIAAGWEEYDSNAGGVGLAVINPIVE